MRHWIDSPLHFEKQHKTRQKIISALAYPIAVGLIAVIVVIFLLLTVVPTFVSMFQDFGADLPLITKFVLSSSEWMQSFWWLVILAIFFIIGVYVSLKKRKQTKYYLDYVP